MNSSRSTLQNPSSSQLGQALDQHSMRLVLQSCLERLDMLDRQVHEEIQEIRSLLMDLDNYQSDITMEDLGRCDSTVNSQAELDGLNAIPPFASSHDRCFMPQPAFHRTSFDVTGPLLEGEASPQGDFAVYAAFPLNTYRVRAGLLPHSARSSADYGPVVRPSLTQPQHSMYSEAFSAFGDPRIMELSSEGADPHLGQFIQDVSLRGTSDSVYEPAAQPFQGINYEEHVPLNSSARPNEELSVPVVQASQVKDKVKCTWYGCSTFVNKDNLTRHVKEVHEGKIKAVCAGCGREFKRPYQMNAHILQSKCGRS
ncbi:hypothetical protein DFJ58DRAFT_847460 [Suillus subalutaceus]|uniref:uncharacterized protein n=1 Tax=Suillus subalutaceus TaxID=48586 RepID=UPI001B87CA4D|nr:uncharacterized protein DFJ58DRAFT_847460 [Suillus subalutaceus]KAG1835337.1 hypothetical protein DFJ58DRAFT_847460 [Suillus subalutaceus]